MQSSSPDRQGAAPRPRGGRRPDCGPVDRPEGKGRKSAKSDETDRRAVDRSVSLEFRGWLGWWEEDDFRTTDARLLDIGQSGALIEVDDRPPRDRMVLFGLRGPAIEGGCVPARVAWIAPGTRSRNRVGLAFAATCPRGLLKKAAGDLGRS